MKVVGIAVALALAAGIGLAGIGSAEEKDTKTAAPAAAEPQKPAAKAEKKQPVKLTEEEARKVIAAKVNGAEITLDEVTKMVEQVSRQMAMAYRHSAEKPGPQEIEKEAFDRLIAYELAYQKAKAEGITAEKSAIDAGIEKIKTAIGEEKYKELVEHDKAGEAMLRAQVEKDLMVRSLFAREVTDKITVSEAQMKEEYEKEKKRFIQPEKISLVDVVIPLSSTDKEKEADGKAQDILKKIRENGDDPNKLTQDGTFTVRDYAPDKEKDKELIEAARKLKAGEISGVIKADDGLHIVKLTAYLPEKQATFDEVKGLIESTLKTHEQTKKAKEWVESMKKDAKIEILMHATEK